MTSVSDYHNRTKHGLQRYARGPETIDWSDQPDPFRRFDGCERVRLPMPGKEPAVSWAQLTQTGLVSPQPVNPDNLGLLLELAFGISAWKQYGPDRWALRCNPSSGNLHPSEAYLATTHPDLFAPGVYHYSSYHHALQRRCLLDGAAAVDSEEILIGLNSIHWREAWKYGERAYRYCQHDAGHAYAALTYAAALLGWRVELLSEYGDAEIAALTGIDRADDFVDKEREFPEWLCRIHYNMALPPHPREQLTAAARDGQWTGKARSLGAYHMYEWKLIEEIATVAAKPGTTALSPLPEQSGKDAIDWLPNVSERLLVNQSRMPAAKTIRQRRSAQRFQGDSPAISQQSFFRMLSAAIAYTETALAKWPWTPAVHLCLFVHKVENVDPGLYALPRSGGGMDTLKKSMNAEFAWRSLDEFPPLYRLHAADVRGMAKTLSCHQSIASDSAFSLAMLAEFDEPVNESPWQYRRLFWECGMIGQILYLEAETMGLRGTGIGCFFDDDVHGVLGIRDSALQSLYHFTVGLPLTDSRIATLPAYAHLPPVADAGAE